MIDEIEKEKLKKITDEDDDDDEGDAESDGGSGGKPEDNNEDQPRFVKKDEKKSEKNEDEEAAMDEAEEEVDRQGIAEELSHDIRPESNQQRNLDRETGGFEENKKEGHYAGKDVWDERSEEVDKMGSTDVFNTTGMRSLVWKQKRNRLKNQKKHKEAAQNAVGATTKKPLNVKDFDPKKTFDSRVDFVEQPRGFAARIKALSQNHHEILDHGIPHVPHNSGGKGVGR